MKKISLALIRAYQFLFSFDHSFWSKAVPMRACRFEPSCSEYTYQAIDKYGVLKGSGIGAKRILRCHPFAKGGYDPLQ